MWKVRHITSKSVELRLTDIGMGPVSTHAIYADGELLVPYAYLVDPSDNPLQLDVCSHCGTPGCQAGGWAALRSLGGRVLLIPSFEDIQDDGPDPRHAPPSCIQRHGAVIFEGDVLEQARTLLNGLPAASSLPSLTLHEALLCMQLEAPDAALGHFPSKLKLQRELVLACSEEDLAALLRDFESLIAQAGNRRLLVSPSRDFTPIELYLDRARGQSEWSPLARLPSGGLALRLADELVAAATSAPDAA